MGETNIHHQKEENMSSKLSPVHPGEVLLEEFIKPMGLSQSRLAIDIGVDARRINEIVLGKRAITADTALRLSRFFGNSPQFWMGLQSQYDLDIAQDQLGKRLEREVRPYAMAQ
jgi:antitoxin HigA-1